MERENYIAQWKEVKAMTEGKTMAEVRSIFGNNITNDLVDEGIIDTNYKDILVTFVEKEGKAVLHNYIECYSKEGIFLEVMVVNE